MLSCGNFTNFWRTLKHSQPHEQSKNPWISKLWRFKHVNHDSISEIFKNWRKISKIKSKLPAGKGKFINFSWAKVAVRAVASPTGSWPF